jgi:hypothetical protein
MPPITLVPSACWLAPLAPDTITIGNTPRVALCPAGRISSHGQKRDARLYANAEGIALLAIAIFQMRREPMLRDQTLELMELVSIHLDNDGLLVLAQHVSEMVPDACLSGRLFDFFQAMHSDMDRGFGLLCRLVFLRGLLDHLILLTSWLNYDRWPEYL